MRLTQVTAPEVEAIGVDEVKEYLEIFHSDRDDLIGTLIGAVTSYLDGPSGILGRVICEQVWALELTQWPAVRLALPVEPLTSVVVSYIDAEGAEQTLPSSAYQVIGLGDLGQVSTRPELIWEANASLPPLGAGMFPVTVTMTGGAATAGAVPKGLRTAMIMLAGHWFDNRPAVTGASMSEVPMTISTLLARYRRML